ncbi:MAG: primosomal protein N' [Thermodesulfovibrionales bacterium]|nr:primosomal protein N' [Thermodesulfovibrionales bacterium]
MYAEVVFPLKIKPFTYKLPTNIPPDIVGRIVKAPLGKRLLSGVVYEVKSLDKEIETSKIKEITSIYDHFGSKSTLNFLKWLSEYYMSPEGVALASCFFEETSRLLTNLLINNNETIKNTKESIMKSSSDIFYPLIDSLQKTNYSSFLLHSPSNFYEQFFLAEFCKRAFSLIEGAIILVPEISQVETIANVLKKIFHQRVCILHSKQSRKQRVEIIKGILSGQFNIIVGTRSAILVPIRKISFIAVLSEHSLSYKGEEGLRYNGRDVAVKRGYFENVPVLLSSTCPSVESFYNVKSGKYQQIQLSLKLFFNNSNSFDSSSTIKRPIINIINFRDDFTTGLSISKSILEVAKKYLLAQQRVLFIVQKKGYSYVLCTDCGYITKCQFCQSLLTFYKGENLLKCHRCKFKTTIYNSCPRCNSVKLTMFGVGIEKIKDDLTKFLKEEPIQFEERLNALQETHHSALIIGHGYQIKKLKDNNFKMAVFTDVDISLNSPNFKANELIFQEIMEIAQIIDPNGHIYLQTREPKNKILNYIKNYDFKGFYKNELIARERGGFPPFMKLALVDILIKKKDDTVEQSAIAPFLQYYNDLIILGPSELEGSDKEPIKHLQFLLKSKDGKKLNQTVSEIKEKLLKLKCIKIKVDIDPIRL